ncbi:MAG: hypothetical protein E6I87_09130 [Chloroflexi bacterium]|nr:MAG: hypothetical protein E6I87_09130 [Chloroflexota bacterium]
MPEERKVVTVLFADLVDSTALGAAHDPEVVRATLSRTFDALREVLVAHGATVEKFIGDAVMAVFGVPRVHDDDPDRAVRAAFALRDRLIRVSEYSPIPLQLRVGVNTGEAVAGSAESDQFLVTGPPVNAASRLQSAASPGEILVGSLTARLTRTSVRYAEPRGVAAKGIGTLDAWSALELSSAVPEASRDSTLRAPLIGREREMRLLQKAFARTKRSGTPTLVTIVGPAGVGKTRLVGEFVDRACPGRMRSGRCLPYGDAVTLYPLQLILRAECGIEPTDDHAAALAKLERAVGEVFDSPAEARLIATRLAAIAGLVQAEDSAPDVPLAQLRDELRASFCQFLERRAKREPLALLFEDLHWAEPPLVRVIERLAEAGASPFFVVCLARPDFREVFPSFGATAADVLSLTLEPLEAVQTGRLVRELLGLADVPEPLRTAVIARADGNPLYVEEFLRMLIDGGRIAQRDGGWVLSGELTTLEVPATLIGLIAARLDQVTPEVKRLLQRASLVGRVFTVSALEAIAGEPVRRDAIDEAVRRDLLSQTDEPGLGDGPAYRFKHVLVRDVAYATVSKTERAKLHDNYGRWLESSLGDREGEFADLIAFHAEQAFLLSNDLDQPGCEVLGRRAREWLQRALTRPRRASQRKVPIAGLELRIQAVEDRLVALAQRRMLRTLVPS